MKKSVLLLISLSALSLGSLSAQTLTWTGGGGNGAWSNTANWSPAQAPATGNSLVFNNGVQTTQTTSSGTLTRITWESSAAAFNIGGGTLTFNQAGGGLVNSGTLTQTVSSNLVFASNAQTINHGAGTIALGGSSSTIALNQSLTFTGGGKTSFTGTITLGAAPTLTVNGGTVTFASAIGETGGSRAFLKSGTGKLELLGANTFTGNFSLLGGTVVAGSNTAFGTGAFNLGSGGATVGTLESYGGVDRTFNNYVTLQRTLIVQGGGTQTFAGASGTFGSTPFLTVAAGTTLRINNAMSGSSTVTKNGAGKLVIAGDNSAFVGAFSLSAGELEVVNATGAALGSGTSSNLTVGTSTLLSGTGRLANNSIVVNGTLSPGGDVDGTLHFAIANKITFSNASVLKLQSADMLSFSSLGDWLTINSGAKIDLSGEGWTLGWNTFADNISVLPGGIQTNWSLTTAALNAGYALDPTTAFRLNGNELQLNLSTVPEPGTVGLILSALAAVVFWRKIKFPVAH